MVYGAPKSARAIPGPGDTRCQGQLEAAGFLYGKPVARGATSAWHQRIVGKNKPTSAAGAARSIPAGLHGPAISVDMVGGRAADALWTFRMHPELTGQVAGSAEMKPAVVAFHEVSKWYGNVIGINKLTIRIPGGVTGLLGPNGAGKSTLLQL